MFSSYEDKLWPECIVCGVKRRNVGRYIRPSKADLLIIQDELNVDFSNILNILNADPGDYSFYEEYADAITTAFLNKYCSLKCFNQHLKLAQTKARERVFARSSDLHPAKEEFTQDQLRQILIEEEGCCRVCGDDRALELHHIIPQEYGGKTTRGNCVLLCPTCHALTRGQGFINK